MPRYRGASRASYVRSYIEFLRPRRRDSPSRRSLSARYDLVIVCTMPDAAILSALPCRLFGSRIVLDIHDTMPELYLDKFEGGRGRYRRAAADGRGTDQRLAGRPRAGGS